MLSVLLRSVVNKLKVSRGQRTLTNIFFFLSFLNSPRTMSLYLCRFSQDGTKFWRLPECYIRGNSIKYLRIPEEVVDLVVEEEATQRKNAFAAKNSAGRGGGRTYGRLGTGRFANEEGGRGEGGRGEGGRGYAGRGEGGRGGGRGYDNGGRGNYQGGRDGGRGGGRGGYQGGRDGGGRGGYQGGRDGGRGGGGRGNYNNNNGGRGRGNA